MLLAALFILLIAALCLSLGITSVVHGSDGKRINWNIFGPGVLLTWAGLAFTILAVALGAKA